MKKSRILSVLIALVLLAGNALIVHAQQAGKIFRIGLLDGGTAAGIAVLVRAFLDELSKLRWIEGKNFIIEYGFAGGSKPGRRAELAAELVRLKVDLIVTTGTAAALDVKKATNTIPIVMVNAADPVSDGLVASLARPGGNVTGFSNLAYDLNTKRLEILKDAIPKLARVGVLRPALSGIPGTGLDRQLKELKSTALYLKLKLDEIETRANAKRSRLEPTPKVWKAPFKPQSRSSSRRL